MCHRVRQSIYSFHTLSVVVSGLFIHVAQHCLSVFAYTRYQSLNMSLELIIVIAAIVGTYVYHRTQVEAGNEGIAPLQEVLQNLDQALGTQLTPEPLQPGQQKKSVKQKAKPPAKAAPKPKEAPTPEEAEPEAAPKKVNALTFVDFH